MENTGFLIVPKPGVPAPTITSFCVTAGKAFTPAGACVVQSCLPVAVANA